MVVVFSPLPSGPAAGVILSQQCRLIPLTSQGID
jgi:hypothetical protein